ncbi:MAG: DUF167 domain-containing protein [Nanoarchaeota archaeon]|nr:DUF167 domain-containing protein [Nanoarchaeota archaeon]MBU1004724.1 DUF167 domain-containing protein [Nanoarchaeota archaeon]MBU1945345.1 DUF167 domain-containing protein [Nanoarchaeota archaeon]
MEIKESSFKIIVKANSPKNEVTGYDSDRGAYRVNIKAKAEDNKANIEIIRFFSKLLKKRVRILTGLKSKEKIIRLGD